MSFITRVLLFAGEQPFGLSTLKQASPKVMEFPLLDTSMVIERPQKARSAAPKRQLKRQLSRW
jgi:hypothetical protein